MPEGITLKRIIDMDEAAELSSSDYALVDSATGGPKKFALGNELSSLKEDISSILDSAYVTDTASGSIASFPDGANNVPVKSLTVNIEPVQSGSGDPSPDNVRPISGHDTAKVTRTGVNVWDEEWEEGSYNASGEKVSGSGRIRSKNPISCVPSTTYYFANTGVYTSWVSIYFYGADGSYLSSVSPYVNHTFTTPNNARFMNFNTSGTYGSTYNHDISINYPSTDTAYHSGADNEVYEIDLDGTIYGGTLDVTTGELTVTDGCVDLGTLTWVKSSSGYFSATVTGIKWSSGWTVVPDYALCSTYAPDTANNVAGRVNDKRFCITPTADSVLIYDTTYSASSASEFKTAMDGVQLVYELATPQTVTLTPQEVTTLLGQNNIWADTGDVSVEYRADTKLYIQKLTGSTETDMVADANIPNNTYFMIGNQLYLSTAAIASGATIAPGTNCTLTNLATALNALNQ